MVKGDVPMPRTDEYQAEVLSEPSRHRKAAKLLRGGCQFIKGPLPMPWLEQAARLPGKALAVGLLLWFLKGMLGDEPITVSTSLIERFAVGRKAAGRALTALEGAGLIRADRTAGRLARVRIICTPASLPAPGPGNHSPPHTASP
jgi:hypothetical protein